jgi:hypothetical protein
MPLFLGGIVNHPIPGYPRKPPSACKVVDKEVPDFRDVSLLFLTAAQLSSAKKRGVFHQETMVYQGMYIIFDTI